MNRIYQGRATEVVFEESNGKPCVVFNRLDSADSPLWRHHCAFQDAVNYYLVALGAMSDGGKESGNRVIRDLRQRLEESWDQFPRKTRRRSKSLRDSLRPWLGLKVDAPLDDAFKVIVNGKPELQQARSLALELLLDRCSGESAIQQGGRGYFPRLCWKDFKGGFDFTAQARAANLGKEALASVLHGTPNENELRQIAEKMELSWTVKVQPGKFYEGTEAKGRVREAIEHLAKMLASPSVRLAAWLEEIKDAPEQLEAMRAEIEALPEDLKIPRNRKAAPDLTFASIAFMVFPGELTRACLRQGVKEPGKQKKKAAPAGETDFARLGDDPIQLARGERGFVFRAFTALPAWTPISEGDPVWKEFDIAAFKEALKSLNQFNQKTLEREETKRELHQRLETMLSETPPARRSASNAESEDSEQVPILGGDPRFEAAKHLEADLTQRLMLDPSDPFKITRASLRGLRDLKETWNKHIRANPSISTEDLQEKVKSYQADPKVKLEIGSIPLLFALCEEPYRELWLDPDEETEASRLREQRPPDMLVAMVQLHGISRDLERAGEPIRLTPAEPEHSRRLFMFSDLAGKSKVKFIDDDTIEVSLAAEDSGSIRQRRARIRYTAPRLRRDELLGGEESRWLQPMTAALGIADVPAEKSFDSAVVLMPDLLPDGSLRHLLNFPVQFDASWIHSALGKAGVWKAQFNGTKDTSLHLHWPNTAKDATKLAPWWTNPEIVENGFTILANDLGQRNAGAWSLLRVTSRETATNRPLRSIGNDGTREWFAEVFATGMHRLPGEDQRVLVKGNFENERSGAKGRRASDDEFDESLRIAIKLGTPNPESWIRRSQSLPEQNDQLVRLANRRLSRLGTYHRWSCFDPERPELATRRDKVIDALKAELAGYEDAEVMPWRDLVEKGEFTDFRKEAGSAFVRLRSSLLEAMLQITNRTVPLRGKIWTWLSRGDESPYGELAMIDANEKIPKIRGQRGLSMNRLEQLDGLRRIYLRYNRILERAPGVAAKFGRDDRGRDSGEPCPDLLKKIDRMKEQRVNQTAHLILAQALGVRLRSHQTSGAERSERNLHGEYEKIPGREPVDFIVIEDLSRYLASQGRAPSENSRLMKWAHRAVRDKLKMLSEEPFGIPVVEVVPSYSSRFHAVNGQPGARLVESKSLKSYARQVLERLATRSEFKDRSRAAAARQLLQQFDRLESINRARLIRGKLSHTLFLPRQGGPLFLAARDGKPTQADVNAATNLGLRAVAAPDCIGVLRRVRASKKEGHFRPRRDNAREKAAYEQGDGIELAGEASRKLAASSSPNFFFEPDELKRQDGSELFDQATLNGSPLVSGVALWSMVNDAIYLRCASLNEERLSKWQVEEDAGDQIAF